MEQFLRFCLRFIPKQIISDNAYKRRILEFIVCPVNREEKFAFLPMMKLIFRRCQHSISSVLVRSMYKATVVHFAVSCAAFYFTWLALTNFFLDVAY